MNLENILNIQTKKEIFKWFNFLRKDLITNNNSFFHYTQENLQKYLRNPELDLTERFNQFYSYWNNFNNQKRLLQRFFQSEKNNLDYPDIFKKQSRQIVHHFTIDFNLILTEINTLKLNNKHIPYVYNVLIQKLVKIIITDKLFPSDRMTFCNINILTNTLQFQIKSSETHLMKIYNYKLNKFIYKWQTKFPELYKTCKAYLIVSSNYKDILLQSTFKQWTSCLNLINLYIQQKVKYSCVNNIKNGNLVAYCILDLNDGKSIDEIMDDLSYHGLAYNRCFWRSSIKRLTNINNKNDYLFVPQCTAYGTIMQNAITFSNNLFYYLHEFISKLNNSLQSINKFNKNQYYKTYKIMYPMFSDMFTYISKNNQYKLYYFNEKLISKKNYDTKLKNKLLKYINYNILILTNDILSLLNIFKFFSENYKTITNQQEFINQIYFKKQSFVLKNSYISLNIIENN